MLIWGIIAGGLVLWLIVSVVLGVLIGRGVRIADAHRADQDFVMALSKLPEPGAPTPARAAHRSAPRAPHLV